MSDGTANGAPSTSQALLPYEVVQQCSKALSTALDSLSEGLSDRAKSAFSAMADEIENWDHTRIWEHPSAPYTQHFRDSTELLNTILNEDAQGDTDTTDPGLAEAHSKLKALQQRLTVFDGEIEALERLTMFQRAEYASRITWHLVDCRIAEPLSSQFFYEAEELHESFSTEEETRETMRSARNSGVGSTWRDNIQDLRTALDTSQASTDQEARTTALRCLDELATAADALESEVSLRDAVKAIVDDVEARDTRSRRSRRRG